MDKNIKKIILISLISLLGIGVYLGNKKLKDEKRWFYATGTNEVVFGEITWGMSQQEVERVVGEKLSYKHYPTKSECGLQAMASNIIDRGDIFIGNYSFRSDDKFDEDVNPNIVKKSKRLFGKPMDNFLGIQTGSIAYRFYEDKLFSVTISPSYTQVVENNEELKSKKDIFEKKTKKYFEVFANDLHSKFGRLYFKKSSNGNKFEVINLKIDRVFLDGFSFKVFDKNSKCNKYSFNLIGMIDLRYRPIVEEINKDNKEGESSFFK